MAESPLSSTPGLEADGLPSVQIHLDGLPPNPNTRRHHMKVYADNQVWKTHAFYMAKASYKGQPFEKAHVHYHFSIGSERHMDLDNLVASTKPVTDGLKGVLFVDDSIDHITMTFSADHKKPKGMTITVTEKTP